MADRHLSHRTATAHGGAASPEGRRGSAIPIPIRGVMTPSRVGHALEISPENGDDLHDSSRPRTDRPTRPHQAGRPVRPGLPLRVLKCEGTLSHYRRRQPICIGLQGRPAGPVITSSCGADSGWKSVESPAKPWCPSRRSLMHRVRWGRLAADRFRSCEVTDDEVSENFECLPLLHVVSSFFRLILSLSV